MYPPRPVISPQLLIAIDRVTYSIYGYSLARPLAYISALGLDASDPCYAALATPVERWPLLLWSEDVPEKCDLTYPDPYTASLLCLSRGIPTRLRHYVLSDETPLKWVLWFATYTGAELKVEKVQTPAPHSETVQSIEQLERLRQCTRERVYEICSSVNDLLTMTFPVGQAGPCHRILMALGLVAQSGLVLTPTDRLLLLLRE